MLVEWWERAPELATRAPLRNRNPRMPARSRARSRSARRRDRPRHRRRAARSVLGRGRARRRSCGAARSHRKRRARTRPRAGCGRDGRRRRDVRNHRPHRRRHGPRGIHGSSHRRRVRKVAGASVGAPAGRNLVVRRPRIRFGVAAGADRRRGAARGSSRSALRSYGEAARRVSGTIAEIVSALARLRDSPGTAADRRRAGGRSCRACRRRLYRATLSAHDPLGSRRRRTGRVERAVARQPARSAPGLRRAAGRKGSKAIVESRPGREPLGQPQRLEIVPMTTSDIADVMRIERALVHHHLADGRVLHRAAHQKARALLRRSHRRTHRRVRRHLGRSSKIRTSRRSPSTRTIAARDTASGSCCHLIDEAIERGAAWMTLEVRESNDGAKQLVSQVRLHDCESRVALLQRQQRERTRDVGRQSARRALSQPSARAPRVARTLTFTALARGVRAHLNQDHRYAHSVRVARCAELLAQRHGLDTRASAPGGHAARSRAPVFCGAIARRMRHPRTDAESTFEREESGRAARAAGGRDRARTVRRQGRRGALGDRKHTLGDAEMSPLDCAVYLADALEPGRDYPERAGLWELACRDLDEAMRRTLAASLEHYARKGDDVAPQTAAAVRAFALSPKEAQTAANLLTSCAKRAREKRRGPNRAST